jgi:hypothetical protein
MKKMNYKIIALTTSITLLLSGCETMQKAATGLGSTGTGVIAGVAAGAGAGFACDKLTGGKNTGACIAAGMAVGAAVGTWAAKMDEEAEKAVPAMDCTSVKRRMNYSSSQPKAGLKFAAETSHVVKPGTDLKIPMKMDLVTPGTEGQEEELTFKIDITAGGEKNTGRAITKACGGDYDLPLVIPTEKEGVYNTTIQLLNASDNSKIEGGVLNFCYTVAKDGVDKCGKAQNVQPASFDQPVTSSKKAKKKGKGKK